MGSQRLAEQGSGRSNCVDSKQRLSARTEAFVGINIRRLTVDRAVPADVQKCANRAHYIALGVRFTVEHSIPHRKSAHKRT